MKYEEYKQKMETSLPKLLRDKLLEDVSIWTNEACYGYVIQAMEAEGYSDKEIGKILRVLHIIFDDTSPEEAEAYYRKW